MLTGPDHRVLIPASALIGGVYLIHVDNVARASIAAEIPVGIITAMLGAPVCLLLRRAANRLVVQMIKVQQAAFRYSDEWVFRNVSFTLAKGQTAAILGPNGKGKTTLLKSIIGLHPLAEGSAETVGQIGYVAQKNDIAFSYKVIDVVVMGRAAHIGLFQTPSHKDYQI